ncbi:hypothetical protein [Streptomyces sp. AcE210]|uniref:hypothetical protein n=1 Tax=Streptomyces sp. AcE210 TaxID=2292703 RepID=UPI0014055A67|nr:hypothetical protein [Streptomyces sp. AcE210]
MYVLAYAEDFFSNRHSRVEFVAFEYRIASLAWLRSKIEKGVDSELAALDDTERPLHFPTPRTSRPVDR